MADPLHIAFLLQDATSALSRAVDWWETVQAVAAGAGNRGVSFAPEYEPSWLSDARRALDIIKSEMH